MKCIIIINAFRMPKESVLQAQRLKDELVRLNVDTEIVSNGSMRTLLDCGKLQSELSDVDFIIYLDKDKYLSHALSKMGVKLYNSHNSIRICDDKGETYLELANKGFNLPKTVFGALCYAQDKSIDGETVDRLENTFGYPMIVKESFGSMGKGVYKADNRTELLAVLESVKLRPHIIQEYLGKRQGVDVRIIVIGGKAVASMERFNDKDFRSNVGAGGGVREVVPSSEFIDTAERVAKTIGLDYCGIDLLYGDNDKPYVCEVNSNAFFEGMEKATGKNIAKLYAEFIVNDIKSC
ncbi:MAG: RimK family alpha-L-glutamate ligase [Clostridiales bacterium]|nr:RimK family alpha-L-glutamate ligase [Clostridiales bacterium]